MDNGSANIGDTPAKDTHVSDGPTEDASLREGPGESDAEPDVVAAASKRRRASTRRAPVDRGPPLPELPAQPSPELPPVLRLVEDTPVRGRCLYRYTGMTLYR